MTPKEINEAVARKLGWKKHKKTCEVPTPGASIFTYGNHWYLEGMICREFIANYCSSIAAAWEIVEKFKEYQIEKLKGPTEYYVRLGNVGDKLWAKSETAPMAICLAFLKLP